MDYTGEMRWLCDCNTWNHLNTYRCSNCDSPKPYLLQPSRLQPQPPSTDNSDTVEESISLNDAAAAGNGRWSEQRFHSDTSLQPEAVSTDTEELGRGHLEPVRTAAMEDSAFSLGTSLRNGSRSGRRFPGDISPQPETVSGNIESVTTPAMESFTSSLTTSHRNGRRSERRFPVDMSPQAETVNGNVESVTTSVMESFTSSLTTSHRSGRRSGRRFLNEASLQPETLSPDEKLSNLNSYLSTSDNLESGRTVAMEDSAFSLGTSLRNGRRSGRRFPGDMSPQAETVNGNVESVTTSVMESFTSSLTTSHRSGRRSGRRFLSDASPHPETVTTDEEKIPFPDKECRMVLIGKTGSGKSSTGNTILGKEEFKTDSGFSSCTRKCQWRTNLRFGVKVEVTDTPGLFDTNLDCNASREIARCFGMIVPGPHAIVVVLRLGMKFTEEEAKVIDEVRKMFGEQLARYLVIVFTHGEQLHNNLTGEDSSLEALKIKLADAPDSLKRFIQGASNRCVVFSNNGSAKDKAAQVKCLLNTICKLLSCNGGKPYTNQLLDKVENHVKEEENEIYNREQRIHRSKARDMAREALEVENTSKSRLDQILKELVPELWKLCKTTILPMLVKGLLVKYFAPYQ